MWRNVLIINEGAILQQGYRGRARFPQIGCCSRNLRRVRGSPLLSRQKKIGVTVCCAGVLLVSLQDICKRFAFYVVALRCTAQGIGQSEKELHIGHPGKYQSLNIGKSAVLKFSCLICGLSCGLNELMLFGSGQSVRNVLLSFCPFVLFGLPVLAR